MGELQLPVGIRRPSTLEFDMHATGCRLLSVTVLMLLSAWSGLLSAEERPNVIVILTDDQSEPKQTTRWRIA